MAQRLDHGSMFLRAAREGIVDPARSIQVGIRTHNDHTHGFNILHAPWVHRQGSDAVIAEIKRVVGEHKAYLTFDIDCLDPAFAPGTGTPVVGGLSSAQALEISTRAGRTEPDRHGCGGGSAGLRFGGDYRYCRGYFGA